MQRAELASMLTLCLGLSVLGCARFGLGGGPAEDPNADNPLNDYCKQHGPCVASELDAETLDRGFELLDELQQRFPRRDQLPQALIWIQEQRDLKRAHIDELNATLFFQLNGGPTLTYRFYVESGIAKRVNQLNTQQSALVPSTSEDGDLGVFTKEERYERSALFSAPLIEVTKGRLQESVFSRQKSLANYLSRAAHTYKERASWSDDMPWLTRYNYADSPDNWTPEGRRALVIDWLDALIRELRKRQGYDLVHHAGHAAIDAPDSTHELELPYAQTKKTAKVNFQGILNLAITPAEPGVCAELLRGFIELNQTPLHERPTQKDVPWELISKVMPSCGLQHFDIYTNALGQTKRIWTTEVITVDTGFLLELSAFPIANQLFIIQGADLQGKGIPMFYGAATLSYKDAPNTTTYTKGLLYKLFTEALTQGDGLAELVKAKPELLKDPTQLGKAHRFVLKSQTTGLRLDETISLGTPAWSGDELGIRPHDEALEGMTLVKIDSRGAHYELPIFVVGPWDRCDLNNPQLKLRLDPSNPDRPGEHKLIEATDFKAIKRDGPYRAEFSASVLLNKPLTRRMTTMELQARYVYRAKAGKDCPSSNTIARAIIRMSDPEGCSSWRADASNTEAAGDVATIVRDGDRYIVRLLNPYSTTTTPPNPRSTLELSLDATSNHATITRYDGKQQWTQAPDSSSWSGEWMPGNTLRGRVNGMLTAEDGTTEIINISFNTMPLDQAEADVECIGPTHAPPEPEPEPEPEP